MSALGRFLASRLLAPSSDLAAAINVVPGGLPALERHLRGAYIAQDTTITLPAGVSTDVLRLRGVTVARGKTLKIVGTPTVLGSGVVSGYRALSRGAAGGQCVEVDAAAMAAASWTAGNGTTGFVGRQIKLTSGASSGAYAWIAKDLAGGSKTARCAPFYNESSTVAPTRKDAAIGDTFDVLSTSSVYGFDLDVHCEHTATCAVQDVESIANELHGLRGTGQSPLTLVRVKGGGFLYVPQGSRVQITNAWMATAQTFAAALAVFGGVATSSISISSRSWGQIDGDVLCQGGRVQSVSGSHLVIGAIAACDVASSFGVLNVRGHSRAAIENLFVGANALYGVGNTQVGIFVEEAGSLVTYVTKPTLATTAAVANVRGVTRATWDDVPYWDATNQCGILAR